MKKHTSAVICETFIDQDIKVALHALIKRLNEPNMIVDYDSGFNIKCSYSGVTGLWYVSVFNEYTTNKKIIEKIKG